MRKTGEREGDVRAHVMGDDLERSPDALLLALEQLLAINATSLKSALNQASEVVIEALGGDKVDVFLYEQATTTLVALGTSATPMGYKQHALGLDRDPIANGGIMVEVFQTGQPYHTGHADEDSSVPIGYTEALGIRSMLGVPLDVAGERRGVMQAASAQPDFFTERDLRFLQAVARWVGMVVHRVELVEQVTAEAAEEGRRMAAEELVTVLAHDLRNYLAPIQGRLQLLQRRASREERGRDLQDLAAAAGAMERLQRVIADLLDAARLEQGLFTVNAQPFDLAVLARETATTLGGGTPIEVYAPEEVVIYADADRIRQALENLVANAVTHSPAGTMVTVEATMETRANGAWGVLTVADRGPGIPPVVRSRLFERFGRGPGSAGLGLGLYLAHRIATIHGGTLTVDDDIDIGTRFRLALPTDGLRNEG